MMFIFIGLSILWLSITHSNGNTRVAGRHRICSSSIWRSRRRRRSPKAPNRQTQPSPAIALMTADVRGRWLNCQKTKTKKQWGQGQSQGQRWRRLRGVQKQTWSALACFSRQIKQRPQWSSIGCSFTSPMQLHAKIKLILAAFCSAVSSRQIYSIKTVYGTLNPCRQPVCRLSVTITCTAAKRTN